MEIEKKIRSELAKANFDPHSPTPLYYQAYAFLTNLISSDLFQIGDLLPPEIELAKWLSISRQTLRQTMNLLVEEGLVERFSGRGTFIREKSLRNEFFMDRSFSQQMTDLGKITHSKIIKIAKGKVDKNAPGLLHTNLGAPCLYLTRLRYVDQTPIGLQKAVILTARCPDIDTHDFTKESLFHIFTEVYQLVIAEIYHEVNAVIAPEKYTRLLEIDPTSPVLLERSITYLSNNEPIEATTSYYRSDKYKYSVRFRYMNSKTSKHTPAQGH
jgi:DNA-binding GntR family transcriptional regulator